MFPRDSCGAGVRMDGGLLNELFVLIQPEGELCLYSWQEGNERKRGVWFGVSEWLLCYLQMMWFYLTGAIAPSRQRYLRSFEHLKRMFSLEIFRASSTGRRPRTSWRESHLIWERLFVPRRSCKSLLERGTSGLPCSACCHRDLSQTLYAF